ncbi:hypothetical protein JJL56_07125 [Azospirillum sp. YIM DDC1]|uniref:Uncharacterized protein n=1 Tax=Azospirillum aestuarii TaxID=2802052 RepID=A0ABS1HUZ0_9PROT|nr:hypothetical protein [Azospirillum aestuarii]
MTHIAHDQERAGWKRLARFDSGPISGRFSRTDLPVPHRHYGRASALREKLSRMQGKLNLSLPFMVCGFTMREHKWPKRPFDCAGIWNDHWTG